MPLETWTRHRRPADARAVAGAARTELLAVAGIAASVIADQAPKDAAITVTCDGPRTRIYCLYDEDAIDGTDANEDALGFDPLKGDWRVSLPCSADDLAWVQGALKKHSARITAREPRRGGDGRGAARSRPRAHDPHPRSEGVSRLMTSVAVYTYTHSVTYVADNILKSFKDIIRLSGLDPAKFVDDWDIQHARASRPGSAPAISKASCSRSSTRAPTV